MIGDKLKQMRVNLGLSLQEVGDAVGVAKSTVRCWETGNIKNMRRDKIAALAKVLHTTPAFIMELPDEKSAGEDYIVNNDLIFIIEEMKKNDSLRALAMYAAQLSPENIENVKNIVENLPKK